MLKPRTVKCINLAAAGTCSADWVAGGTLANALVAAIAANPGCYVSIMLGTNDSIGFIATSAATFGTRMQGLVNACTAAGAAGVFVHYPPWFPDQAHAFNNAGCTWYDADCARLASYQPMIDGLSGTLPGDRLAYAYFAEHQSETKDGIHPNEFGIATLGYLHATAIAEGLNIRAQAITTAQGAFRRR
jgi:lysophospholipase L1-like esterase